MITFEKLKIYEQVLSRYMMGGPTGLTLDELKIMEEFKGVDGLRWLIVQYEKALKVVEAAKSFCNPSGDAELDDVDELFSALKKAVDEFEGE